MRYTLTDNYLIIFIYRESYTVISKTDFIFVRITSQPFNISEFKRIEEVNSLKTISSALVCIPFGNLIV